MHGESETQRKKWGDLQAPRGKSVFICNNKYVWHQNTLILPGREGKGVQNQASSLGKAWGIVMPNSLGSVSVGLSLPSASI